MFRKTVIAAVTVAVVATSAVAVTATTASAKNGRNGAFAAGAILGLATGAIVGSQARERNYYHDDYPPRRRHCWDKPVRRWDPYYQRRVVVGYRTVCR